MSDLPHLKLWGDPAIRDGLSWYLDVAENRRPAKFRIAATLATQIDPGASSEDALWAELDRLTPARICSTFPCVARDYASRVSAVATFRTNLLL
jgi:hypothetical protein